MKKIKFFATVIACVVCLCVALTGCSGLGSYVYGSFNYKTALDGSYYDINYNFSVDVAQEGDIEVDYVILIKDTDGKETYRYTATKTFTDCKANTTKKISARLTLDKEYFAEDYSVAIKDVKVYNSEDDSTLGYAIGFGVTGGLMLCAAIAAFAVCKIKDKKEN